MRLRQERVGRRHDVAVDVAAGRDGVERGGIDRLHRPLQVRLDDAVKLEGLARGQAQRPVGVGLGDVVERQPLLRADKSAGNAQADHEAVGLLQLLLVALAAHVAVVLHVGAVELDELGVVFGDRAGHGILRALPPVVPRRKRLASLMCSFLERLSVIVSNCQRNASQGRAPESLAVVSLLRRRGRFSRRRADSGRPSPVLSAWQRQHRPRRGCGQASDRRRVAMPFSSPQT